LIQLDETGVIDDSDTKTLRPILKFIQRFQIIAKTLGINYNVMEDA